MRWAAPAAPRASCGGHDEKEQTLNQLLVELDGFDPSAGIVLLGATNRPEILDPALLRAGRFDRQVLVDRPDRVGRVDILAVHMAKVKSRPRRRARADRRPHPRLHRRRPREPRERGRPRRHPPQGRAVERQDFNVAIERIVAGLEKRNRLLNPREREIVAFHEMGHTLAAAASSGTDPVHKVSIIPRGIGALGYTIQRPTEDRYLMTREELEGKLVVLLGGRAAEALVFEHTSTGAADDLSKATDIARSMVTRYGMVPALGPVSYETEVNTFLGPQATRRNFSEETAREIDLAVRDIVQVASERARTLLAQRRQTLEKAARLLLEKETLTDVELKPLLDEARTEAAQAVPRVVARS